MNQYILAGFKREMDSFPIEYTISKDDNDKYMLEYKNLPTELDFLLVKAKYEQSLSLGSKDTVFGHIKETEHTYQKVCNPITTSESRILQIDISDEYYVPKLNQVSSIIRNYFHKDH